MRVGPKRGGAGGPAGPVVVTVDLTAQTLFVLRAGYAVGTAVILYRADEKPPPPGIFPVRQKDADHVSSLRRSCSAW